MKPDISEFSYGYAVTEELIKKFKAIIVGAPIFPSLYEEGKKGGYDVAVPIVGRAIFLQFKLSDYLYKLSAKESDKLNVPYYRMHLRPLKHSKQHELLRKLESNGELVFYIAPEFHLPEELNDAYLNQQVLNRSAAFSPNNIGKLDDQDHYVVFEASPSTKALLCSNDPMKIIKHNLSEKISSFLNSDNTSNRKFDRETFQTLTDSMWKSFIESTSNNHQLTVGIRSIIENMAPWETASFLARTLFDSELLIVPE